MSVKFDSPEMEISKNLFMLRGAYGYKGFSEHLGGNMYKVDSKAFQEAIENAIVPMGASKVSSLSFGQIKVLNNTLGGSSMIPLLNRMGELGMMDFREGMVSPEILNRVRNRLQSNSYTSTINAYKRSI